MLGCMRCYKYEECKFGNGWRVPLECREYQADGLAEGYERGVIDTYKRLSNMRIGEIVHDIAEFIKEEAK